MSQPALPLNAWLRWDLVRRMVPAGARTVLEVGCGQGAVGARLAEGRDYLGVEPDGTSFATAQARIGAGRVRNGMVDDVVEPGRTFDLVCAFEVLEHLEDDADALAGWTARVAPGGWLMLSTPAFQDRYGPFDRVVGHYRRYELDGMRRLLEGAGLVDVEVVAYGAGLGEALEAARNVVGRKRLKAGALSAAGHSGIATGTTTAPTAEEMAALTAGSGRLMQPPAALALATQAATAPFRLVQRRFPARGTGLVARGRKPA